MLQGTFFPFLTFFPLLLAHFPLFFFLQGEVLGITRFGVTKMKDSVLMLASFEKTTDHLFNASFNARRDPIQGVSECIILGSPANNIGTAMPALVADKPKLPPTYRTVFERPERERKGKARASRV